MGQSTSIKLKDGYRERLKALAAERDITPNQLMNEAILDYVERKEKRAAFLKEARERWDEYKLTGERVSREEAEEWIDRLLAGDDPALPGNG
ncbi:MAG: CopG family transcriptional regulator [Devosia sp.]